jgi:beta-phosphoglucomutase-like phosphatase (HAD superfamily)
MPDVIDIIGIGPGDALEGLEPIEVGGDGRFVTGREGVEAIFLTADRKVEFIAYGDKTLAYVRSAMGYPAIYPLEPASVARPIEAVLMDLDGTSVHSEHFWIWIIQQVTARLLKNPRFEFAEADLPHVSGHSVSEHLQYCIDTYCPHATVERAREIYTEITAREMQAVLDGSGRADAFEPAPGLKDFLLTLKDRGIKIGLVTSGLHVKAWPEILAAFRQLDLGDPLKFYDAIITAGVNVSGPQAGTLGELQAKPHPWLYAETARVGLGIKPARRSHVVGMEDSGAGVVSIRLAGFACIGVAGGNIHASGTSALLQHHAGDLHSALDWILDGA